MGASGVDNERWDMKITDITLDYVEVPLPREFFPTWRQQSETFQGAAIVRVYTDEGIVGIGGMEANNRGWGRVLKTTVEEMIKPLLLGKDPTRTEDLIRYIRGISTFSARPWFVENALWDIVGKICHQPIYKLWGGYQDRVLAYASWGEMRTPAQRAEDALFLVEQGFKAVKMRIHHPDMKDDLALVEAVRKAVGEKLEIMVDANQATAPERPGDAFGCPVWSYERAKETALGLEDLGVLWLEEPLPRYDLDGLTRLSSEVDLLIAGGEFNRGLHEFRWLLERGCYDIIQPSCSFSEGMFQVRKIGACAEMYRKDCMPHAWTSGPGFIANLHVAASLPNCPYIEYAFDPPAFTAESLQGTLQEPLYIDADGYVPVPQKPGLGIELHEETIERFRVV
jgi:L-alanine-DL-glutamate epimerase-like enolase superfamily enzyme